MKYLCTYMCYEVKYTEHKLSTLCGSITVASIRSGSATDSVSSTETRSCGIRLTT